VQILVVVAFIQVVFIKFYSLKTEVEKGFLTTAFDQELIDPKSKTNLLKI